MTIIVGQYQDKRIAVCTRTVATCDEHFKHITVKGLKSYIPSWSKHTNNLVEFLNEHSENSAVITVVEDADNLMLNHFQPTFFDDISVSDILNHTVEDVKKYGLGAPDYAYVSLIEHVRRLAEKLREETSGLENLTHNELTFQKREVLYDQVKTKQYEYKTLLDTAVSMLKDMEKFVLNKNEEWEYYTVMLPSEIVERIRKRDININSSLVNVKHNNKHMYVKTLYSEHPLTSSVKHVFTYYNKLEALYEPQVEINVKAYGGIISPNVEIYHWVRLTPAVSDLVENYVHSSRLHIAKEAQLALNTLLHVSSHVNNALAVFHSE